MKFYGLFIIVCCFVPYCSCEYKNKVERTIDDVLIEGLNDKTLFFRKGYVKALDTLYLNDNEKVESLRLLEIFSSYTTSVSFVNVLILKYSSFGTLYFFKLDHNNNWELLYTKDRISLIDLEVLNSVIDRDKGRKKNNKEENTDIIYNGIMMRDTQLDSMGKITALLFREDDNDIFYNEIVDVVNGIQKGNNF